MTELTSGINTILVETGSIDLQYVDTGNQFQLGMHSRNVAHTPNILAQRMLLPRPIAINTQELQARVELGPLFQNVIANTGIFTTDRFMTETTEDVFTCVPLIP